MRMTAFLIAVLACPGPSAAQTSYIDSATRRATIVETDRPLPTIGKQESFRLVTANVPSATATTAGGDYILAQTCSSYGTLTLQVLGPDGATWLTLLTKTASDTAGGTGLALGSFAVVRATVSGTNGCNAILSRVPA